MSDPVMDAAVRATWHSEWCIGDPSDPNVCDDDSCQESRKEQAKAILNAARPHIAAEALRDLHAEMSKWEGYDTRDIGWAFLATLVLEHIEDRADDLEAGR